MVDAKGVQSNLMARATDARSRARHVAHVMSSGLGMRATRRLLTGDDDVHRPWCRTRRWCSQATTGSLGDLRYECLIVCIRYRRARCLPRPCVTPTSHLLPSSIHVSLGHVYVPPRL